MAQSLIKRQKRAAIAWMITLQTNHFFRVEFNKLACESHRVPLPVTLLNTIKTRNYISKELDLTYRTAKKGLTLLGVALLDEDEIPSINELHKYITSASLRSHEEINNLKAPKLHGKFHGAAQGDCKLALCAFHCILPPLSQTK